MRTLLILIFLYSFGCFSLGQEISPSWEKMDVSPNGTSEAWAVDVDESGNIYWVVSNNKRNEGLDIEGFKFERGGSSLWANSFVYGGMGTQHAYVGNVENSGLYIGGRSCNGLVTTCDMLVIRVDHESGNLIWDRTKNYAADGYDEVDGLCIEEDGIYVGGWCQELNSSIYQSDIGLWKLDFDGNTEWSNSFGAENTAEHQDGHFVVDDNRIYAAGLWGGTNIANLYNGHSFIGSFDRMDGNFVDSTLFGFQSEAFNDIENALGMTSDGEYLYITGYSTPNGSNDWQIFVSKFDKNLRQIWFTSWGGEGTESARAIAVEDGIIYVGGLSESEGIISGSDRDGVLLTLDTSGIVLNYQTYSGSGRASFMDIVVSNGDIYLTGTLEEGISSKQSFLLALEQSTDNEENISGEGISVNIAPNPTRGLVHVQFMDLPKSDGTIEIFDSMGRQIAREAFDQQDTGKSIRVTQEGILMVNIVFDDYRITRKIYNRP